DYQKLGIRLQAPDSSPVLAHEPFNGLHVRRKTQTPTKDHSRRLFARDRRVRGEQLVVHSVRHRKHIARSAIALQALGVRRAYCHRGRKLPKVLPADQDCGEKVLNCFPSPMPVLQFAKTIKYLGIDHIYDLWNIGPQQAYKRHHVVVEADDPLRSKCFDASLYPCEAFRIDPEIASPAGEFSFFRLYDAFNVLFQLIRQLGVLPAVRITWEDREQANFMPFREADEKVFHNQAVSRTAPKIGEDHRNPHA